MIDQMDTNAKYCHHDHHHLDNLNGEKKKDGSENLNGKIVTG